MFHRVGVPESTDAPLGDGTPLTRYAILDYEKENGVRVRQEVYEYLVGYAHPERIDHPPEPSVAWGLSNHHCEAYTGSLNALLLSHEIVSLLEFPSSAQREQHQLFVMV